MAKDIKYVGESDFREIGLADLKKAGYDGDGFSKSTFTPHEVYTVDDDAAADAILALLPNEFQEASDKDLEDLDDEDDLEPSVKDQPDHTPGAPSGGDSTPVTGGTSGRGSTRGSTPSSGTSGTSTGRKGRGSTS